uniref:3-hydroxyacyl-CoA dehydrogenase type-2-like n=1 Tax=Styela clava TaxID=7725 RepID=UPI00193982F5|nr:3-hydroxyacyl-CoA dehydrogenase type-2-like [Styela clava]
MVFRLGKLVAVVTGGSTGLGLATAQRIVKQGGKVTIIDRSESRGIEAVEKLGKDNCAFCPCDVTNTEDLSEAVDLTLARFDAVHVLVNCVGTSTSRAVYNIGRDLPHPLDLFQEILDTNIMGTFNAIRCFVPEMAKNEPDEDGQRGVIINTSSTFAFCGQRSHISHSTSKAAVAAMTLPLARELGKQGIRTVAIAPGYFSTPNIMTIPENIQKLISHQNLYPSRLGNPDEYAMLAQSIIENTFINGTIIKLDGALRSLYS